MTWTLERLAAKDAEIAALRERCGRLANEVVAWRQAWKREDIICTIETDGDASHGHPCLPIRLAQLECGLHNDLQPPAGKESTDG